MIPGYRLFLNFKLFDFANVNYLHLSCRSDKNLEFNFHFNRLRFQLIIPIPITQYFGVS